MDDTDRAHLVANIVTHASTEVTDEVQLRVIAYWSEVDADLGTRVADGLGHRTDGAAYKKAVITIESRANRV
jgi:catalase